MNPVSQILKYFLVVSLMVPMLSMALIVAPFSSSTGWRIVRSWNRVALWVFGVTVQVEFAGDPSELDGGGILVGLTQQSLLDPTAGYAAWDKRVMSIWNIEYALIPFFGWVTVLLGWIIIRQRPEQKKRQLRKAAEYAASGGLVYLSAEGQRSLDGSLSPYKKGPIVLAIESQAPILPLYMSGSRECLPVGEWKIRPGNILVRYLPAISTTGLTYEDRNTLLDKLRAIGETEHNAFSRGLP